MPSLRSNSPRRRAYGGTSRSTPLSQCAISRSDAVRGERVVESIAIASRIVDFPLPLGPMARNPAGSIGSSILRNERNSSSSRARRRIRRDAVRGSVGADNHGHDDVCVGLRLDRPQHAGLVRAIHPNHDACGAQDRKHVDEIARVERNLAFWTVDRSGHVTLAATSLGSRRGHFEVARCKLVVAALRAQAHYVVVVTGEESRPANRGQELIATDLELSREFTGDDLAKIGKRAIDQARIELGLTTVHDELRTVRRDRQLYRFSAIADYAGEFAQGPSRDDDVESIRHW